MGLKLNGATSGSIEIDVPAVAGTDTAITIPATTGGEFIVSDSSGNIDLGPLDINGGAPDDSVNIDGSGRLLVGTSSVLDTSNAATVHVANSLGARLVLARNDTSVTAGNGLGGIRFAGNDTTDNTFTNLGEINCEADGTHAAGDNPTRLVFSTTANGASSPTERMRIRQDGEFLLYDVYTRTDAASVNVVVKSDGSLRRSVSSIKYKTNVETLQDSYADAILNVRPVWYRSLCEGNCPEHSWWGFIAEEVAEIDPRLVHWKTSEVSRDEEGAAVIVPCDPEPEGVAYDRFVPHLLNLIKRQKEQLDTQAATIAALDARLTALEGGAS